VAKHRKLSKKTLKEPDSFQKKGSFFVEFFVTHRGRFLPIAIGAVVLVAGFYAYDWWATNRLNAAWASYVKLSKLNPDERWTQLEKFIKEAPSVRPTYLATVDLAEHHFDEAKTKTLQKEDAAQSAGSAAQWYALALEFGDLVPLEKQLLHINRGKAFETSKKYAEALAEFEKASGLGAEARALAMLNLGRVYELSGNREKATETYELVFSEFADSEYARLAKGYLRSLKSGLIDSKTGKSG